jgi:thymidylate kinase
METLETQQKVREVYLKYVEKGELIRIDGDKTREIVANELFATVAELLKPFSSYISS